MTPVTSSATNRDPGGRVRSYRTLVGAGRAETTAWTAYAGNTLWVTGTSAGGATGTVTRIDKSARRAVARISVDPKPEDGVVVGGSVYVSDQGGDIYRIDAATNTVTARFALGVDIPFLITGYANDVWAADDAGTEAVRIDMARLPAS